MNLSLSTMWWGEAVNSLENLAQRTSALGFTQVELDYRRSVETLPQLRRALSQAGLRICSLHAPFPRPNRGDPLRQADLAAGNAEARRRADALVARTLEYAALLEAGVVVLHAGNIRELAPLEKQLDDVYRAGRKAESDYHCLQDELRESRAQESSRRLRWVRHALDRLVPQAQALGVVIALENRAHFRDLPSGEEMGQLLDEFGPTIGYWHDVGHGFRLEELGFFPHAAWLEAYAEQLVGVHLHDSVGLEDHQPPGQGQVPFELLSPLFPAQGLRVLEVRAKHSDECVAAGLTYLRTMEVL